MNFYIYKNGCIKKYSKKSKIISVNGYIHEYVYESFGYHCERGKKLINFFSVRLKGDINFSTDSFNMVERLFLEKGKFINMYNFKGATVILC